MTEYAKLVLSVDSSSARQSTEALGRLEDAGKSAERGMGRLEQQTRRNTQAAGQLGTAMNALKGAIAAAISVSALQSVAGMVQGYQEMAERVRMASSSISEYEMVQKRLLSTANGTYRSLSEAQELYIRTADSLRSLGYTTQQALDVTDSMSYAFVTNAANAERAGAAINAFAKSMNTGKVAADQWETITTAIPTVINAIADSSGKSAAEVRALGAAGKLTARDLSEGLRKSLEENSKAAANMANNMTDAGVRAKTAMTALFVAIEERSGVIQGVTESIISAADAVLEFSQDAGELNATLQKIGTAAEYAGALIAARLVTAMAAYAVAQGQAVAATIARIQSDNAALSASARRAAAEKVVAMAALATARAEFQAAAGTNAHAFAAQALVAAQGRAAQASAAHAAAQTALNGTLTVGAVAARGFAGAMALLGGPVGVVLLAASALAVYATSANDARQPTIDLTKSVKDLTEAQRELARFEATRKLQELGDQAKKAAADVEAANALMSRSDVQAAQSDRFKEALAGRKVLLEEINGEIKKYQDRLKDLDSVSSPSTARDSGGPEAPTTTVEGQRAIARMREQVELAKLQGEARAKLAAIQALGSEATAEERAEAEKLAAEIYRLEEAQKAATASTKELGKEGKRSAEEAKRLAEEIENYVKGLERQAALAGKSAAASRRYELAERDLTGAMRERAEAALEIIEANEKQEAYKSLLSDLRTDEERLTDQMRERLKVLEEMSNVSDEERAKVRSRIAEGALGGDDRPRFSGVGEQAGGAMGEFQRLDDAEKELNDWYATKLEMLEKYRQEESDLNAEWDEQALVLKQQHEDAMTAIERARQTAGLNALGDFFGQIAQLRETDSKRGRDLAKKAAIAQAIVNTYTAATGAYASASAIPVVGWVMGPIAAAAAIAAGMANVNAIRGMAHDGIDSIPREGTWLLDKGERVVDRRTNQDLKDYLRGQRASNDEQPRQMTRGNFTLNQTNNFGAPDNRTPNQVATAANRKQRVAAARLGG